MKRRDGRKRKAKKKRREEGKGKKKGNYRGKITKMAEERKRKEKRRRKRGGRKGKGRSGRSQRGGAHGGARRWGSGVTPSPGGGHQQTAPRGDAADPAGRPHGNAERQNPLRYPYGRLQGGRGGGHGARPAQRCGNACRERNHPRCAAPHLPHTAPEIDGYINK